MNAVARDIFRAIHEGKWLSIEYRNKGNEITKYWIGIRSLDAARRTLKVDGLHLGQYKMKTLDYPIKIDSILSSELIEGSYCDVNEALVRDIYLNPHKYNELFDNAVNLKILNYLEMCNRMDTTPYKKDFALVRYLDRERIQGETYPLDPEQFQTIVKSFQHNVEQGENAAGTLKLQQLAMNILSIHTQKGLYVLAYRKLHLDVKKHVLRPDEDITICTEFTLDGSKQSVRRFLDADDYELLKEFTKNQEKIKDCICRKKYMVDDMPYIIGLGMDIALDLHSEYASIMKMFYGGEKNEIPVPVRAFFGDLLERPKGKPLPIALINKNINMDQLLAINNAMIYPVAYIQGPPGTGKTNTIINTITTAFFNEKTVLFASYNNHPINGVYEKLSQISYRGRTIPFPILRLGNSEKVKEAVQTIKRLYRDVQKVQIFEGTLERNKDDRKRRARKLSVLLESYEEILDLKEREETIDRLLDYEKQNAGSLQMLSFEADLNGRQRNKIRNRLENRGEVSEEAAISLLDHDTEELLKYLYYTSARYIRRLGEEEHTKLRNIVETEDADKAAEAFSKYLGEKKNIAKLQKIFPIIATTCISAHRLGDPEPMFDMTIMDEASQCNNAVSLVPIIRGRNLMLVGDPQQLNPVILLDPVVNDKLKKKYGVSEEYDYCRNSIYKTFLTCDAVSDEILLHNHYRCHPAIIGFNNQKYYNSQLHVLSQSREENPLIYADMPNAHTDYKNTAPGEARAIAQYAAQNREKSIGVITPFVNQKNLIEEELKKEGIENVICGTVHAFQGDEKDVILFSTAITDQTQAGTYEWLKNNKELINVATSRARDRLILLSSRKNLERLHKEGDEDDLYELVQYVQTKGKSVVTPKPAISRALGVKPFSSATEDAFLQNLNHALENIWMTQSRYTVHKEVAISHVFWENEEWNDLFYKGRFDFVVYEKQGQEEIPMLAIELDGKEHFSDDVVKERDRKKNEICKAHNLQIIRVENSYARRYNHIKEILINYFSVKH